MQEKPVKSNSKLLVRLMLLELLLLAAVSILVLVFQGIGRASAFLSGGLVCFIPTLYQAYSFFRERVASAAGRIVTRFYTAELLKFIFIALVFVALMRWTGLSVFWFVMGMVLAQLSGWLAMPFIFREDFLDANKSKR